MINMTWPQYGVLVLGALVLIWLWMAWTSGAFMSTQDVYGVAPGAFTDDGFSDGKHIVELEDYTVAVYEAGDGPPLILLHGCPFSAVEWSAIIPTLAERYHVIAPDLLGLGDTPVTLSDDYRLPHDVEMVRQLMDHYGIESAPFVGHDHGGATLLLLMNADPDRIDGAVLTNIEAYDQWPSTPELPYLRAIVNPLTGPIMYHLMQWRFIQSEAFGLAFHDPDTTMTPDILTSFIRPHIGTPARWQRLRRFFGWQLDNAHNQLTMDAVPGMRAFDRPIRLLWGQQDENFGADIAERLQSDLSGTEEIVWFEHSGHMPMLEEPSKYAAEVVDFVESLSQRPQETASRPVDTRGILPLTP